LSAFFRNDVSFFSIYHEDDIEGEVIQELDSQGPVQWTLVWQLGDLHRARSMSRTGSGFASSGEMFVRCCLLAV